MATYDGVMVDEPILCELRFGLPIGGIETFRKVFSNAKVSTVKPYAGTYSLELRYKGRYTIDCGCGPGTRTITCKAYAPINGALRIQVVDPDDGTIMDLADTASEDEWEDLEVSFTSEGKVYLLICIHLGSSLMITGDDSSGYIDNVVVS